MSKEKKPIQKRWFIFSGVSLLALVGVVVFALSFNSSISRAEASRDLRLMNYENGKLWVIEDIRRYLKIKDETSYQDAVTDAHLTQDLQKELYGSSFIGGTFVGAKSVTVLDAQYTFEKEGTVTYYVLLTAELPTGKQTIRFLASVKNNTIYDLIAY